MNGDYASMVFNEESLRNQVKKEFEKKLVSLFLDVIILAHFKDATFKASEALRFVQERFGVLINPGKVYQVVYAMEREGLVKGSYEERKRVYQVTDFGKLTLEVATSPEEIEAFMATMLENSALK